MIDDRIRKELLKGAKEIKSSSESLEDALGYVRELCCDVDSDLQLDFEGDCKKEQMLREAAIDAIRQAYDRKEV